MEAELKRIITDAVNEKVVWTVSWDDMPLPQVVMAKRKAQQAHATVSLGGSADAATAAANKFGKFSTGDKKRKK